MSHQQGRLDEQAWTVVIIGIVALLAIATAVLLGPSLSLKRTPVRLPDISPSMVPLMTGQEPIGQLFVRAGRAVCHTIPGIEGAEGRVGPRLVLGTSSPKRLADPRYRGQAKTVREYVIESILNPGTYVVPGYQDNVMPRWYGKKLTAAALEKIVAYLESLSEN